MSALFEFQATNTVSGGGLRALPGATATVYATGTTSRVNLFNTAGAPINNPGVTDPNGFFAFVVAEGIYDVYVQSGALVYTQTIQVAVPAARAAIQDANYAALASDGGVSLITLTAARTITLPPLSTMAPSKVFPVADESGSASPTLTISVVPYGGDLINGSVNPVVIETPWQALALRAGGTSWSV